MGRYLVRRILSSIPVLIVVSLVVFGIGCLVPGDPAATLLGPEASAGDLLALRFRMGLDQPVPLRYIRWALGIFRGDLGISFHDGSPVSELLANRMAPTFSLALFSLILSALIAIPLGVTAALRKGSLADLSCSLAALTGISIPSFLLGLFLILIFAVRLRWFPVAGYAPVSSGIGAHLHSIILPGAALSFMYAALLMQVTRSTMIDIFNSDYVRTAKSKGAGEILLALRHAVPNALPPLITLLGQGFIGALSGAAVVESMFGIPGIGALVASSIGRRDLPVIQAVVLLFAMINLGMNIILDFFYTLADSRIQMTGKLPEWGRGDE
jgi:peptide/nickel transport system permease protein